MSLERQHVSNSSSSVSEVLVDVSSSDSDLASSALYALPVLLLDFLGLTGGSASFEEDGFRGDGFFFPSLLLSFIFTKELSSLRKL
jgi:hypothetical protein